MSSLPTCNVGRLSLRGTVVRSIRTGKLPPRFAISASSNLQHDHHGLSAKSMHHHVGPISCGVNRREAMLQMMMTGSGFLLLPSFPAPARAINDVGVDFRIYSDDVNKFTISIPQDWNVGLGKSDGIKSVTAFYPETASNSNVSVTITGIGPDFTRLESFGKVDEFAESLVNGLDRSWQRPPGVAAKLLNSRAANGLYYIEYTIQNPGQDCRHIFSAVGMANYGWYNRLYTVTGQFMDEEAAKYSSTIEKAVLSFRLMDS